MRVHVIDGVTLNVRVPIPASGISRATGCLVRIRAGEPAQCIGVVTLLGVVQAGVIAVIGGELVLVVCGYLLLLSIWKILGAAAIRPQPVSHVTIDQPGSE